MWVQEIQGFYYKMLWGTELPIEYSEGCKEMYDGKPASQDFSREKCPALQDQAQQSLH